MRSRSYITLLILILIALLIWWYQLVDNRTADLLAIDDEHFVDAYMLDFKLTAMNAEGQPSYTLRGHEFTHFNDSNIATLQQPVVHLLQAEPVWQLSAEQGEINDSQSLIVLYKNVVMQQIPASETASTGVRMRTERLAIDTQKQLASTDLPTLIEYKNLSLRSRGMRLDNLNGRLELLAEVTGVYVTP